MTGRYVTTAHKFLTKADAMMRAGLPDEAGRAAYYAAFHAAQALVHESTGEVVKTHNGVHAGFARIVKDLPGFNREIARFLGRSYNYKSIADYGTDPEVTVSEDEARKAIQSAHAFVAEIETLLTPPAT